MLLPSCCSEENKRLQVGFARAEAASVYAILFQINKPCFLKKELVTFEYALKTEQGLVPSHCYSAHVLVGANDSSLMRNYACPRFRGSE